MIECNRIEQIKDTLEAVLSERQGSALAGLVLGAPCAKASSLSDAQACLLCTEERTQQHVILL